MGSSYSEQSVHHIRQAAPSAGWPGATLTASAYNDQ